MDSSNKFYSAGIILLLLLLQSVFFLFADIHLILDLLPDDAAYYFKIAENFNKGYGFSFDSIHQTNGFQPLWQYILIGVHYFSVPEPETFYRIVLILQVVIISAASFILFLSIKKSKGEVNAYIGLAILLLIVYTQAVNGMESSLLVLMLVFLYAFMIKKKFTARSYFAAGIITGMVFLSRLDLIFLPFILFLIMLLNSGLRKSLLFTTGFLLLFLPYVLTNYLSTGHIQPISGVLKTSFPILNLNFDTQFTITAMLSIILALPAAIYYILRKRPEKAAANSEVMLYGLSASILIHFLFCMLFIKWHVLNYYFIFYGVYLAIISAEFRLPVIKLNIVKSFLMIVFAMLLIKTGWRMTKDLDNSWHSGTYEAALWARNNTDADAVFAMKDAGNFSFLSKRSVINLDGLVNDFYFQEILREQMFNKYLKKNDVSYYVLYEGAAAENFIKGTYQNHNETFMSYKYMTESDTLIVSRENEVYRKSLNNKAALVIWKLN